MIFRVSAALASLVLLAGCTGSDGGGAPTTTSSAPPTTSVPTTSPTTSPTSSAPASPSATPNALATLDGGYLLAGTDPDAARLYRVTGGRLVPATSATGISAVSADDGTVVVGRDTGSAETVQRLRAGRLSGLGIASGFAPALSDDGVLAYAVLGGSSTPGVTKPGGVTIRTRAGLTGRARTVATFPAGGSVLALTWSDDDLVAAVSDGERSRLVVLPNGRGPAKGLVPGILTSDADTVTLVGGDDVVAIGSDDPGTPARVVSLPTGRPGDVAKGWQPVCFADDEVLVVAKGTQLATVAVRGTGSPGAPRPLARTSAPVLAGACG